MVTKQFVNSRGMSSVLGVALVLGLVLAASMVIVGVGANTIGESQSTVSMETAATQMEALNSKINAVIGQPDSESSISVASLGAGQLDVENNSWINVSVRANDGSVTSTGNMTLGQISYTQDDQKVAIQGGGVWRSNAGSDGAAIVSEPMFEYRTRGGNPTLTLPVVDVTGVDIDGDTVGVRQTGSSVRKLDRINPLALGQQVNITIKSEYYKPWGELLEKRTNGDVTYLSNDRVRLTLFGPTNFSEDIYSGIISPYDGITNADAIYTYSYNSSEGEPDHVVSNNNENASISVNGDLEPSEQSEYGGEVDVAADLLIGETGFDIPFSGEVIVGGEGEISRGEFNELVSIKEDLNVKSGPTFEGDLIVGGDVSDFAGKANEDVSSSGEFHLSNIIEGNLTVGDDLHFESTGAQIGQPGDENAVYVDGDVVVDQPSTIEGDLYYTGHLIQNEPLTVTGENKFINESLFSKHRSETTYTPFIYDDLESTNPLIDVYQMRLSDAPTHSGLDGGDCSDSCTLEAGEYYLEEFTVEDGDDVVLNTTGGDISLFVEKEMLIKESVKIEGDNEVRIFANDDVSMHPDAGEIEFYNDGYQANQLLLFMRPDSTFEMVQGEPVFNGIIYGPGNESNNGVDVILNEKGRVYGTIVGDLERADAEVNVVYDESIAIKEVSAGDTLGTADGTVTYIHVSTAALD